MKGRDGTAAGKKKQKLNSKKRNKHDKKEINSNSDDDWIEASLVSEYINHNETYKTTNNNKNVDDDDEDRFNKLFELSNSPNDQVGTCHEKNRKNEELLNKPGLHYLKDYIQNESITKVSPSANDLYCQQTVKDTYEEYSENSCESWREEDYEKLTGNELAAELLIAQFSGDRERYEKVSKAIANFKEKFNENPALHTQIDDKEETIRRQNNETLFDGKNISNKDMVKDKIGKIDDKAENCSKLAKNILFGASADLFFDKEFFLSSNKPLHKESRSLAGKIEKCPLCIDNTGFSSNLVVSKNDNAILMIQARSPINTDHCLIIPINHIDSLVRCDEDIVRSIQDFKKQIINHFHKQNKYTVFMETYYKKNSMHHMKIDCIPIEMNKSNLPKLYFKKALSECDTEWSNNKSIMVLDSISKSPLSYTKKIPKGLPYFAVEFDLDDGGYAHIIEDTFRFPHYFGHEVIGNMLDLPPNLWLSSNAVYDPYGESRANNMKKIFNSLQ